MITLSRGELNNRCIHGLAALASRKLPVSTACTVAHLVVKTEEHLKVREKLRLDRIKVLGVKEPNDPAFKIEESMTPEEVAAVNEAIRLNEEKAREFIEFMEEADKEEITIDWRPVKVSELETLGDIEPMVLAQLGPFLVFDPPNK